MCIGFGEVILYFFFVDLLEVDKIIKMFCKQKPFNANTWI